MIKKTLIASTFFFAGAGFAHAAEPDLDSCFRLELHIGVDQPAAVCIDPLINPSDWGDEDVVLGDAFTVTVYRLDEAAVYKQVDEFQTTVTETDHVLRVPAYTIEGRGETYGIFLHLAWGPRLPTPTGYIRRLSDGWSQRLRDYFSDPRPTPPRPGNCHPGRRCI